MQQIVIHSRLYDYSVDFVADFRCVLEEFQENAVCVLSRSVFQNHREAFARFPREHIFLLDSFEFQKNIHTVMNLIAFFRQAGVRRDARILCFGGGMAQDVTALAASLYLRNVPWYFFPTTLMAMADSCIGGKCGVNFGGAKNQIGAFYPPRKIFIDLRFLEGLPARQYRSGWGEILKFSLMRDREFYRAIRDEKSYLPCANIGEYIYRGLLEKKQIIEEDEYDNGRRGLLNYGHTFGHALEAYSKNLYPHGIAVLWGMDAANYIAMRAGILEERLYLEIQSLIRGKLLGEEISIEDPARLFDWIRMDKKVRGNKVKFALLAGESRMEIRPMEIDEKLRGYFMDYLRETSRQE